jgi:DNA-directed RNA polymerase specialized sigma24 family protein
METLSDPSYEMLSSQIRDHEGVLCARIRRALTLMAIQPDSWLVEEILQEVYFRLLVGGALRRLRGRSLGELVSFLGTVAERTAFDHARQARASKRDGAREVRLGRRKMEQIADPRQSPERDLLRADTERHFLRRCHDLPERGPRGRNAWVARLALVEGWTSREIAEASGGRLSAVSVACLIHRLRRRCGVEAPGGSAFGRQPRRSRRGRRGRRGAREISCRA